MKKGWRSGMRNVLESLIQFVMIVKTNKARLKRMRKHLKWLEHCCDVVPGPRIGDEPRGSGSGNPMTAAINRMLDYELKIQFYEHIDVLYQEWLHILTSREKDVFRLIYLEDMSIEKTAESLMVTYQNVYLYKQKIEKKWDIFKVQEEEK